MLGLTSGYAQPIAFAVATWNVRAGHGTAGLRPNPPFDSNTKNCSDPTRPRNAWGVGAMQRVLQEEIAGDREVVAFGVQEAWGDCANVKNIAAELGWRTFVPERNGVGMIARHGIAGAWDQWRIEQKGVGGAAEDRWIVGANVCLVAGCARTMYMWTTHLTPASDAEWPSHVRKVLDRLEERPKPHMFFGDLNLWENDRWSPRTWCGGATRPMAVALASIVRAGYVDAWAATQRGAGWTGMVSRRGCGAWRRGGLFKRIDYVWSAGIAPRAAVRFGVVAAGDPGPSDHVGVKARFTLP
jgi:exonuclease III